MSEIFFLTEVLLGHAKQPPGAKELIFKKVTFNPHVVLRKYTI